MKRTVKLSVLLVGAWFGLVSPVAAATPPDRPGWQTTWYDDFTGNAVNTAIWQVVSSTNPTNNSQHAYLPSQVTVSNGNLVITSENVPFGGLPYRSGQVISQASHRQQYGRWDVRAKLPTSRGMWPAIWLLPPVAQHGWPSQGEIDIMENRGDQPSLTSSAFHYGTNPPFSHSYVYSEQESFHGELEDYHDSFHTYSVEWEPNQLRFYVDGVHHYTVHDSMVGGFLSNQTAGMDTIINTAVGGTFLEDPDGSTVWPQEFLIDHVHVYEANATPAPLTFDNGAFDETFEGSGPGTLTEWTTFGNRGPNVQTASEAVRSGTRSLKLFGQFNGSNVSGVEQGISVTGGEEIRALTHSLIRSADSLAGTDNELLLKIDYYNTRNGRFGTSQQIGSEQIVIANGSTLNDAWLQNELRAVAPDGAVEARLALVYRQIGNGGGAVHVDDVLFGRRGDDTLNWDGLGDGNWIQHRWTGAALDVPTDFDRAVITQDRVTVTGVQEAYTTHVHDGGSLGLAGSLTSDVTIDEGGAIEALGGTIEGNLTLRGDLLLGASLDSLVVQGTVDLTGGDLALAESFGQTAGTLSGNTLLLNASSLTGFLETVEGDYLGEGVFVEDLFQTPVAIVANLYAAIPGDANGDRTVDGQDFIVWNNHKFTSGNDWLSGDFNGDGVTDGQDFVIWNNHKFTSVDGALVVPEPVWAGGCVWLLLWCYRRSSAAWRSPAVCSYRCLRRSREPPGPELAKHSRSSSQAAFV